MVWGSSGSVWGSGGGSASGDRTTDYGAMIQAGIAKAMAVNPELGARMAYASASKSIPETGLLSGIWNSLTAPIKGGIEVLGNITSMFAEPFRDEEEGEEDNFMVDMAQGLFGQENTTWRDNLMSYGWEDNFATTAVGFMGDVFLDPTTYVGVGLLGKGGTIVAKGGQQIAESFAKQAVEKSIAQKGGLEFGGRIVQGADDLTAVVTDLTEEGLKKIGVSDEVAGGLGVITASNAEQTILANVDALAQRSYESVGRIIGDTILQRKSIHALPKEGIVDDIGRHWSKEEIVGWFEGVRKMGTDDLMKTAQQVYGKGFDPTSTAGRVATQQMTRTAAAVQGGFRLKFGLPFGERLAKQFDSPFLGYRWTSAALPWANRVKVPFTKAGNGELAFSKVGDYFRGLSGINRLDQAITQSIRNGDGVWRKSDMEIFLRDGFTGLKHQMVNEGGQRAAAFDEVFGDGVASSFMAGSERIGSWTAALTPGAQAWRRAGIAGLRQYEAIREAKVAKKIFRQYATQNEETWTQAAKQYETDAKKGLINREEVTDKTLDYLEGITDDLAGIPEYMHGPLKQMREMFPKLLTKGKSMGAPVGDTTGVMARRKAEGTMVVLQDEIKRLSSQIKLAGDSAAKDPRIIDLRKELAMVKRHLADEKAFIENQDRYDDIVRRIKGVGPTDKVSPTRYFHRRLTREARDALIGSRRAETKVYNKAKTLPMEQERRLWMLPMKEAEAELRKRYPALQNVSKIWEDNPFAVYGHYVEDMAETVYKAQLGQQVTATASRFGAVDNGAFIDFTPKVRGNMPNTVAELEAKAAGQIGEGKEIIKGWLDNIEIAAGAKIDPLVDVPDDILKDFGWPTKADIPGAWKEGPFSSKTEVVPLSTLRRIREHNRASILGAKGSPKLSRAKIDELKKEISERGFDKSVEIEVDAAGRVIMNEGNHRLVAAEELGLPGIPATVIPTKGKVGTYSDKSKGLGELATKEGVAKKFMEKADDPYVPQRIKPSEALPAELLGKGTVPQLPEAQLRRLQGVHNELNKLRARISDVQATPEVAIKTGREGVDKRYWGRLDIPGISEELWAHPYIAAEFNKAWHGTTTRLPGAMGSVQQRWRSWVIGPWKKWATIYWPGFHARNAMGAWFNNMLGGVREEHYRGAHRLMDVLKNGKESKWATETVQELEGLPLKGRVLDGRELKNGLTYGELADIMQDLGITSMNSLAMADLRMLTHGTEETIFKTGGHRVSSKMKFTGTVQSKRYGPVTSAEWLMRNWEAKGVSTTGHIENWMRGAAFLRGLEETAGDTAGARAFTMMRHGDYDELTDAEMFIKDLLPFYKWLRTNLPFQVRRLVETPGKSLAVLDLGEATVGPDKENLPSWMREGLNFRIPGKVMKGVFDLPGVPGKWAASDAAYLSLQLPLSDVFISSNEFASSFLPVVRQVIVENHLFKKNLFTGAPIDGTKYETLHPLFDTMGFGHVLTGLNLAERNKDGDLIVSDKMANTIQVFPIFARNKNFIFDDPKRRKLRVNALVSMVAGMGLRPFGEEELNAAEADYYYSIIEPELTRLREQGYKLPSIDDLGLSMEGLSG